MSNRFFKYYAHPNKPTKRGKKDDYIKRLKEQRDEFEAGLAFALTLIPAEKLPNGVSLDSLRWLVGQGRKLKEREENEGRNV